MPISVFPIAGWMGSPTPSALASGSAGSRSSRGGSVCAFNIRRSPFWISSKSWGSSHTPASAGESSSTALPTGGGTTRCWTITAPVRRIPGSFSTARKLIETGTASEMDAVLDLWISAIYQDDRVAGSNLGPVAYFRNGTGNPLVSYTELAQRWGHSRSTVGRMLKKLSDAGYLELMSFPGRSGSVIYLKNYLSTMFQISDILVDKEEVALRLNIVWQHPDTGNVENTPLLEKICVSNKFPCVSKPNIAIVVEKVVKVLESQGVHCLNCPESSFKLYPLSNDCKDQVEGVGLTGIPQHFRMVVFCRQIVPLYRFELSIAPLPAVCGKGGALHA